MSKIKRVIVVDTNRGGKVNENGRHFASRSVGGGEARNKVLRYDPYNGPSRHANFCMIEGSNDYAVLNVVQRI